MCSSDLADRGGRRSFERGATEGRYRVPGRTVEVVFRGCQKAPRSVRLVRDGRDEPVKWRWLARRGEAAVSVPDSDRGFKVTVLG
mgnify:CR=1 FL=1